MGSPMQTRLLASLLVLGTLSVCGGCAKSSLLRIEVSGPPDINKGIPFNLLVRAVSVQQFRSDAYATVAQLVAQRDASVLHSDVVFTPQGQAYRASLSVSPPKEGGIGVYFLFTAPTGRWRILLESPLPRTLRVRLGDSSIVASASDGTLAGGGPPALPALKQPEITPPELPEVKAPEVKAPELKPPEAKPPEIKAPGKEG